MINIGLDFGLIQRQSLLVTVNPLNHEPMGFIRIYDQQSLTPLNHCYEHCLTTVTLEGIIVKGRSGLVQVCREAYWYMKSGDISVLESTITMLSSKVSKQVGVGMEVQLQYK